MKIVKFLALFVGFALVATACAAPTDVKTGGSNNVTADKPKATASKEQKTPQKRFNANFSKDFDGVKLNVAEIVIKPDRIEVGLNYQNSNNQKVSFFPDQGNVVVGDLQLNVDPLTDSRLTTGEVAPGVKTDGVLVFLPPTGKQLDLKKVSELKFDLGDVTPDDFSGTTKVNFTISVPK
jgi:hypothetical protein